MGKIETIEHEIAKLSPAELAAFRAWFGQFDANAWDQQIAEDVAAGKLDAFADAALKSFQSSNRSEL